MVQSVERKIVVAKLFFALCTPFANAKDVKPVQLRENDIAAIVAAHAERESGAYVTAARRWAAVADFGSPDVAIAFDVIAGEEGDYAVGLILGTIEPQRMEARANESVIMVDSLPKTWEKQPCYHMPAHCRRGCAAGSSSGSGENTAFGELAAELIK